MAGLKRKCETSQEEGAKEETVVEEKRRRVEFQDVTVYHFNRRQGHICVPSQVRKMREMRVVTTPRHYSETS